MGEDGEWWGGKSGDDIITSVNGGAGKKLVVNNWTEMRGRRLGGEIGIETTKFKNISKRRTN